ncbi:sulfotransferase [Mesorhizobium loti]|nr:sulfotransferase [Mesorhizobium loti]
MGEQPMFSMGGMGAIVKAPPLRAALTRPGEAAVRVMGVPRSGTNLAKYLLERYLGVPVVFDQGFWKHGVFPALMNGRDMEHGDLPIIVMSKDPVSQILSWYRLARNNTIFKPNGNLGAFLGKPFEVRQDFTEKRMEYRFRSPADYWNQFYFAMDALRRTGAPVHFVCYEQIVSEPALCLHMISHFLGYSWPFDVRSPVDIPHHALGASNDIERAATPTPEQTPFDSSRAELSSALARIGWRNASAILRAVDDDVLGATGRPEFRKTCRQAAGAKAMLRSLVGFW